MINFYLLEIIIKTLDICIHVQFCCIPFIQIIYTSTNQPNTLLKEHVYSSLNIINNRINKQCIFSAKRKKCKFTIGYKSMPEEESPVNVTSWNISGGSTWFRLALCISSSVIFLQLGYLNILHFTLSRRLSPEYASRETHRAAMLNADNINRRMQIILRWKSTRCVSIARIIAQRVHSCEDGRKITHEPTAKI